MPNPNRGFRGKWLRRRRWRGPGNESANHSGPDARVEFDEAFDWYEARRAGLGDVFVARVQDVFDRISATPTLHAAVFRNVRKAVVRKFPYCVFYREEATCVRVLAVFHSRRDPKIWQGRA